MDKYGKAVIEGVIELALSGVSFMSDLACDAAEELESNFFKEIRRCAYRGRKILALRVGYGIETYCWLEPNGDFHAESSWDEAFDEVDAEIRTMEIDARVARFRGHGRLPAVDSKKFLDRDYS